MRFGFAIWPLLALAFACACSGPAQGRQEEEPPRVLDVDLTPQAKGKSGWHDLEPIANKTAEPAADEAQEEAKEAAPVPPKPVAAKKPADKKAKKKVPPKAAPSSTSVPLIQRPASAYDVTINGKALSATTELDPWLDGTRIFASPLNGSWYTMTWAHESHVRLVAGLGGHALRAGDGGTAIKTDPVTICFRAEGKTLACHDLDGFVTGQEIHFEMGERAFIRTPQDIIDMGLWPRMAVYSFFSYKKDDEAPSVPTRASEPTFSARSLYQPLKDNMMEPWMPSAGGQQAVHSTTSFARWALWPNSAQINQYQAHIRASANEAASWAWHLHSKGSFRPMDVTSDYYAAAMLGDGPDNIPKPIGNIDDKVEREGRREGWVFDGAHLKIPGWEMYLLTGDPYFLRQWQMGMIASSIIDAPGIRTRGFKDGKPRAVVNRQQPRAYGKGLMLLLRLVKAMPEGDWNWLQPKPVFEGMLADTAHQAKWMADTRTAAFGRVPRSSGSGPSWGMSHSAFQAIWSVGWAVHLGHEEFRPLLNTLGDAAFAYWDAFGPELYSVGKPMKKANKKSPIATLDDAFRRVRPQFPNLGPNQPPIRYNWRTERIDGVFQSLGLWHGGRWQEIADQWAAARLKAGQCFTTQGAAPVAADGCPKIEVFRRTSPDWMFASGAE